MCLSNTTACYLPPSKGHNCRRKRSYKGKPVPKGKSYPKGKAYPKGDSYPKGKPIPKVDAYPKGKPIPKGPSYPKGPTYPKGKVIVKAKANSYLNRYYYDAKTDSCVKFHYDGCGGNKNNFKSQFACSLACRSCKYINL